MLNKLTGLSLGILLTSVACASSRPATSAAPPAVAANPGAAGDGIYVARATPCRDVAEREPVAPTGHFTVADGRAYAWCEIKDGAGTALQHVYYHEGTRTNAVDLDVRHDRFRTWSYKTLTPGRVGNWRVDIVADGTVLHSLTFQVAPAADAGP